MDDAIAAAEDAGLIMDDESEGEDEEDEGNEEGESAEESIEFE